MNYLRNHNFTRVERDDRLLDIFRDDTLEKGIELWERWDGQVVALVRFHLPYSEKRTACFIYPRHQIEKKLLETYTGNTPV